MRPAVVAVALGLGACSHAAPAGQGGALAADEGQLFPAIEGRCSRLSRAPLAGRTIVVHGRDADAPDGPQQTLSELVGGEVRRPADLLDGLKPDGRGYVTEELQLWGVWPGSAARVDIATKHEEEGAAAAVSRPTRVTRFGGAWPDATVRPPEDQACGPPEERRCWRELATRAAPDGGEIMVGYCGSCTSKVPAPLKLVALHAGAGGWTVRPLPDAGGTGAPERVALDVASAGDATLAVVRSEPDDHQAYLARFDGRAWSRLDTPFPGPATGVAGSAAAKLWVTASGALWRRSAGAAWQAVALPGPALAGAPAGSFRAVDVVAPDGPDDVWIEVAHARDSGYRALLRTRRPETFLRCDAAAPAAHALTAAR
jgi:hypothetical protein